jgi:hypothetical protein
MDVYCKYLCVYLYNFSRMAGSSDTMFQVRKKVIPRQFSLPRPYLAIDPYP